ncbi:hypothetical protein Cgig2_030619 [Carnegiea gigantea]|uniref:VQ domain-containing protein n=1 Tax=Carnegiea gigantea TaxID=171969 RepID=A0A9Q1QDZ9_9CARY|nr:hypothetical protein Cgig2_030619 [Carnegiea gigantea]
MEFASKFKDTENPSQSPLNSPHTSNESVGVGVPITRSDPNSPYPTTFVTADTSSFKQVVQMLTGAADNHQSPPQQPPKTTLIPPIKKQGFKLYERRNYSALNDKSIISPLTQRFNTQTFQNASFSPRHKPEILSPSLLDFPSLTLSPVTPLTDDPFDKSSPSVGGGGPSAEEEERAIAEKGFYLHPSPLSTPRDSEPQLLPLFPLSSPRVSDPH